MPSTRATLELAAIKVRQISQPYVASLNGPTAVRKVFHKQDDALEYARKFGYDLMVFSYETSSLGHEGQRLFVACGIHSFYHYYKQMNPVARCHYEVIPTYRPAKLYLDLEFSRKENPDKSERLAVDTFVNAISAALHYFYGVSVNAEDILILDASTERKFSQHVLFNSPRAVFENNLEQGQLIRLTCDAIERLVLSVAPVSTPGAHQCSTCSKVVERLVDEAFLAYGVTTSNAIHCLFRAANGLMSTSICDTGVYTRNRNFRLAGSHKLTGIGVLWPATRDKHESFEEVWPNATSWAQTLVTSLPSSETIYLRRPVPQCECTSRRSTQPPSSQLSRPVVLQDRELTCFSPSFELRSFIDSVVNNWYARGKKMHPMEGYGSPPSRWKIRVLDGQHFSVTSDNLRFCEHIERPHRSNHVILIFDLLRGCYHQKCLDPDCRTAGFRSQTWPIPPQLCSPLTSTSSECTAYDAPRTLTSDITDDDLILCGVLDTIDVAFTEDF